MRIDSEQLTPDRPQSLDNDRSMRGRKIRNGPRHGTQWHPFAFMKGMAISKEFSHRQDEHALKDREMRATNRLFFGEQVLNRPLEARAFRVIALFIMRRAKLAAAVELRDSILRR